MRYIPLLALAVSSVALHAQYTVETTRVSAQLTGKVNTKSAKVGDPVLAKTTTETRLFDGTRLPLGTKLTGQVTEVHAKSNDDKTAHLAFSLTRAILRDGAEISLHATLAGLAPPAPISMTSTPDAMSTSGAMTAHPVNGADGSAIGNTSVHNAGGIATSSPKSIGSAAGTAQAAPDPSEYGVRPVASDAGSTVYSTTALQLNHVPIAGMPGITLTSSAGATSAGALDANGHDISLESGTQLTLNVSSAAARQL